MTFAISSAEPSELFTYKVKGRALDAALVVHSNVLRAALLYFEVTCRESGFQMKVSHSADWMASYAHDSERVDDRVGEVGGRFLMADTAVGLVHVAVWAAGHVIDARNWVADKVDDAKEIAVSVGIVLKTKFTEAAVALLGFLNKAAIAASGIVAAQLLSLIIPPHWARFFVLPLVLAERIRSDYIPPHPVEQIGPEQAFTYPKTAAELFQRIDGLSHDAPIEVVNMGNNRYMVLIKGTPDIQDPRGWYGGANLWETNLSSSAGFPSVYSRRVQQIIESQVPEGATLYLAGHSQGGHAAQIVANEYAGNGKYAIGAMYSFGAFFVAPPNPKYAKNAKAYLFSNDILNSIDKANDRKGIDFSPQEEILWDSNTFDPTKAHGQYAESETLKQTKLIFDTPEEPGQAFRYSAPDQPLITEAITQGSKWTAQNVMVTSEYIAETSQKIVEDVDSAKGFVSSAREQAVAGTLESAETLSDFVDNLGVL